MQSNEAKDDSLPKYTKFEDRPRRQEDRPVAPMDSSGMKPPLNSKSRPSHSPFSAAIRATATSSDPQNAHDEATQVRRSGEQIPEMMSWKSHFDEARDINVDGDVFRCYLGGGKQKGEEYYEADTVVVFLHGCGHGALSWALVAREVKSSCMVIAYDARGHGRSKSKDEANLSAEQQVQDAAGIIDEIFQGKGKVPQIVLCGQSMGGAIATKLATAKLLPTLVGLVVIDVVEGTAISALPYMRSWADGRKKSFTSIEKAVKYVVQAGFVRNYESAQLSVPDQLVFDKDRKRFIWRTQLQESEKYWKGWFEGMSKTFLSAPAAKLLILASTDRLDRELTIAHMQGKFQNVVMSASGHAVHEDRPEETAKELVRYLQRNMFIEGGSIASQSLREKMAAIRVHNNSVRQ